MARVSAASLCLMIFQFSFAFVLGNLKEQLHTYETLHHSDIVFHHISKRSLSDGRILQERIISFDTLGRHFKLHLHTNRKLFNSHFSAVTVDIHGHKAPIAVEREEFYEGFVEGQSDQSKVTAYWEQDALVVSIKTPEDTYIVEPSWRHLARSPAYSMIAYRASDLKKDKENSPEMHMGRSFCGYVSANGTDEAAYTEPVTHATYSREANARHKRQASVANRVCKVLLVADYHFTQNVGDGNTASTAKYMIGVIAAVNSIYENTDFGGGYTGLGFEIGGIEVFPTATTDAFNVQKDSWVTDDLLNAFGRLSALDSYCLGHLFTYLAFDGGVLGLGWIASPKANYAGGICSQAISGTRYNSAWTSNQNSYGHRLLTREANIVTAHGHNWGSPHDPSDSPQDCTPSTGSGGKYLMYTYAVSGDYDNNEELSPCSRLSIKSVLESKAASCFTARSEAFCGNHRVEEGEQCDSGSLARAGEDPCCDVSCKLRTTAQCSDANSVCCSGCAFAPSTDVCSTAGDLGSTCEANTNCTGSSPDCPDVASFKPNGDTCHGKGSCLGGECERFCEYRNLTSCVCENEFSCQFCCRATSGGECETYKSPGSGLTVVLPDGRSCIEGYCVAGTCVKEVRDNTARIWDVIENLDFNAILVFMRNNIVLATVIISLVLYIPLCIVVWCCDRREEKRDAAEAEWHSRENDRLVMEGDSRTIKTAYRRRAGAPGDSRSPVSSSNVHVHRY